MLDLLRRLSVLSSVSILGRMLAVSSDCVSRLIKLVGETAGTVTAVFSGMTSSVPAGGVVFSVALLAFVLVLPLSPSSLNKLGMPSRSAR